MNITTRYYSRLVVFFLAVVLASIGYAQDDNPTGATGAFGVISNTGCA